MDRTRSGRRFERRRPTDIALLGDNGSLYFLPQQADHTLASR
jgi:hypothetical protein